MTHDPDIAAVAAGLPELADRCERAEGPDRELDLAIYEAATIVAGHEVRRDQHGFRIQKRNEDTFCSVKPDWVLAYTASIDAALTLVPEGFDEYSATNANGYHEITLNNHAASRTAWGVNDYNHGRALALCAAALRARAHLENARDQG